MRIELRYQLLPYVGLLRTDPREFDREITLCWK
jgi:hypothetical protein